MGSTERSEVDSQLPLALLVNPSSGGGRSLKLLPPLERLDHRLSQVSVNLFRLGSGKVSPPGGQLVCT